MSAVGNAEVFTMIYASFSTGTSPVKPASGVGTALPA